MSEQYPGGFVTKTPPTPAGPYENSSGYGIWNLSQQAAYKAQGLWPTAGAQAPDAQFNYVTMLLHGDGTNGAQNNTFLDSSTNNFTITRNGNTTQGSFSPYGSNWSNYFNASATSYLSIPSSSAFAFGTGDFTVEFWVNYASASTGYVLYDGRGTTLSQTGFTIYTTSGTLYAQQGVSAIVTATAPTANTWHHIAFSRSGSSNKLFVDGVQVGSTATDSTNYATGYSVGIGAPLDPGYTAAYALSGYMSNVRVVKGTAVYTSNFTLSTTPLTAISGTSLLTCQSNRFVDNSSNAFTLTVGGSPSVQRFNPFGTSTAYSTAAIGGSGYFDGSGDYLSAAANAAFQFGTGDFCIEYWYYPTSFPTYTTTINSGYTLGGGYVIQAATDGKPYFYTGGATLITATTAYLLNAWNHFAVCRSGTTLSMFINGVRVGTTTDSTNYNLSAQLDIGIGSTYPIYGYMEDVRLVKGSSVYTPSSTTLTVPTAPLTAISGTSLLLGMTNGAIYDNAMMNDLQTAGTAQISTSVKKYGTGSMYFPASTDRLVPAYTNSICFALGAGDFTIEGWMYMPTISGSGYDGIMGSGASAAQFQITCGTTGLGGGTDNKLNFNAGSDGTFSSTTTVTNSAWHHFAVVRVGSSYKIFIDGVLETTAAATAIDFKQWGSDTYVGVGQCYHLAQPGTYLDEVRITKGYARYTATFTPPTAAFSNTGPT